MDPRELVEITFRLPLEALGRLSPLLEAVDQRAVQERTEGGEASSFDMARFEAVRAGEPELPESRTIAAGEPEAKGRTVELTEPVLPGEAVREAREIDTGKSVRQEREVPLERLVQGTAETVRTTGTAETETAVGPRELSAQWERDARRYDGAFPLL